jgi:hypothetical protein
LEELIFDPTRRAGRLRKRTFLLALCVLPIIAAAGCHGGIAAFNPLRPAASPTPWSPPAFLNAAAPLDIPTYDGSGQAVHPDVVYFHDGWHGHKYWMAVTPYPNGNDSRENPSMLVSEDGRTWSPPDGLKNPVVPAPSCDHNSDPDLVYNPGNDKLYLYYTRQARSKRCAGQNANDILLLTSGDGVDWSAPQSVMHWNLDSYPLYLSPAVVLVNGTFHMWMAGGGGVLHTTSKDGITWSPVEKVDLAAAPWHLDVLYVDKQYLMDYVDSPNAGAHLMLATSSDGLKWTTDPNPLLSPSNGWDNERIYRSTLLYDASARLFKLWYSAKSDNGQWHIGYAESPG